MKIEEYDFSKVSAEEIYRLAHEHPAVYSAVTLFQQKKITWEQMLIGLVDFLVKQNKNMFEGLVKEAMNSIDSQWEIK